MRERASGKETVIARDIDTEDAHRAACQQWVSGGKRVAYHNVRGGLWSVHAVELETLAGRQLAEDRQLGFGRTVDDVLPLYGPHWKPGPHRDLELLDAATGEVRTALTIGEVGYTLIDSETGHSERLTGLPSMGSGHPSASPDGKLIVTDLTADRLGGNKSDWAVIVCDARGGSHVVVHQFDNSGGARSWRRNHPHPIFSADGRRIYFNVNTGDWTQLYVAECEAD